MKPEKAIEVLKVRSEHVAEINIDAQVAYKLAIEALEKDIPKHVRVKNWSPSECPTCTEKLSELLGDGYYKHYDHIKRCRKCGQLLKWD